MHEDLSKYSGTLWGVVRVSEELASQMREKSLREIEAEFTLRGEKITLRMKSS